MRISRAKGSAIRPVNDHGHVLGLAFVIVTDDLVMMTGIRVSAGVDLVHNRVDVSFSEQWKLPQVPIGLVRAFTFNMFYGNVPFFVQKGFYLFAQNADRNTA